MTKKLSGLATISNPCLRSFRLICLDALPLRTAGPLKRVSKAANFVWPWPSDLSQSRTPGPWASRSSTRSFLGFCAVAAAHLRVRGSTHAVKMGGPAHYEQVGVTQPLAACLTHRDHDHVVQRFETLAMASAIACVLPNIDS